MINLNFPNETCRIEESIFTNCNFSTKINRIISAYNCYFKFESINCLFNHINGNIRILMDIDTLKGDLLMR